MSTALTISLRSGLILLLLMPLVVVPEIIAITGKALYARALIELITALWVVGLIWKLAPRPRRSWVLLVFAAYVAIAMVSAIWGVNFTSSIWSSYLRMMGVWDLFHWFMIVAVAASVLGSPQEWRSLINCSLIVGLVLSLMALVQAYLPFFLGHEALTVCRAHAVLMHPSTLAAILVVTTLLAVGFLVQSFIRSESPAAGASNDCSSLTRGMVRGSAEERNLVAWRVFWSVVVALGMWALMLTGTRGALLGLVGGAVIMPAALFIWGNRRALLPVTLAMGIILLAGLFLFTLDLSMGLHLGSQCKQGSADKLVSTSTEEQSVAERLISVKAGMKAFLDRPLLGWGPENYAPAFDRFVDPVFFRRNDGILDRAHNKVVGELVTKGALGAIAYLGLWMAMVWTILRRRRPPREEILAYTVLGALAGYFVQNLFLFDTPASMLQLALLIAWVASQGGAPEDREQRQLDLSGSQHPVELSAPKSGVLGLGRTAALWSRGVVSVVIVILVGLSLYHLHYQPYLANKITMELLLGQGTTPMAAKLSLAEKSFDTFPPLANLPRALFFRHLASQWDELNEEERAQAMRLVIQETTNGLEAEPGNFQLMLAAIPLLQKDPENLPMVESLLERLQEVAPVRIQTHALLAEHEFLQGNYQEAKRIADEYVAQVPGTESYFQHFNGLGQPTGLTP